MNLGKVDYLGTAVPPGYKCHGCGAHGVKLWREAGYSKGLQCCDCAGKSQKEDVSSIRADGRIQLDPKKYGTSTWCDTIGWMVPAVPTEEGDTFWGYTSVPEAGCVWWRRLANRVSP